MPVMRAGNLCRDYVTHYPDESAAKTAIDQAQIWGASSLRRKPCAQAVP